MTQEIIKMARDSGMELYGLGKDRARFVHHLEAFAKLVAEKALKDHAMQKVQRLGQEIEPDDIASILACRDMLDAQPVPQRTEQEPVAWLSTDSIGERHLCFDKPLDNDPVQPLFTSPPQRTWVGLTEDERDHLAGLHLYAVRGQVEAWIEGVDDFAQAIEAKLKEKNT